MIGAIGVALLVLGASSSGPAIASDRDEAYQQDYIYGAAADPSEEWLMANGARLYDNWINALDADKPEATHPAWPASNTKKKGAVTWRCKSCHGWDYAGKDWAYATGSYKTGMKGVRAFSGKDPTEIHKVLMVPVHGITHNMIPENAMMRIAALVSRGQIDVSQHVNAGKLVKGYPERGKSIFQDVCAACHGFDGRALDWGDPGDPEFVGTEAQGSRGRLCTRSKLAIRVSRCLH